MTIHQIGQNAGNRAAAEATRKTDMQVRHARELVSLFARHSELRGVHAMADFFDDAVRWTA